MVAMSEVPWIEASTLGIEDSHATWALAARMRLEEAARDYHAVVRVAELADHVQQLSRVRTHQQPRHWLGDVLFRTMEENARRGEPFLAALCVNDSGRVGSAYAGLVEHLRGDRVPDADGHASRERLDCYRHFGAELPAGGGEPGPLPSAAPRRTTARERAPGSPRATATRPKPRVARSDIVPKVCDRCFMALPASGLCDTCD